MASRGGVTRVVVHPGLLPRVSQAAPVRAVLRQHAEQVAARARQIVAAEGGGDASITVRDGVRPGGRSYANVESTDADGEFGTSRTERRRTLGRAADIRG